MTAFSAAITKEIREITAEATAEQAKQLAILNAPRADLKEKYSYRIVTLRAPNITTFDQTYTIVRETIKELEILIKIQNLGTHGFSPEKFYKETYDRVNEETGLMKLGDDAHEKLDLANEQIARIPQAYQILVNSLPSFSLPVVSIVARYFS
jgi:hypothetical protein